MVYAKIEIKNLSKPVCDLKAYSVITFIDLVNNSSKTVCFFFFSTFRYVKIFVIHTNSDSHFLIETIDCQIRTS